MNGITIAHADPARLDEYLAVFDKSTLSKYYGSVIPDWVKSAIEKKEAYVALSRDDEVAGYISITMNGMFEIPDVTLIGVADKYRGKGIGEELLQFYIGVATCLGNKEAGIVVNDFNPRARKLYIDMGFKPRKSMDCPYGLGGLCHLLVKKLG